MMGVSVIVCVVVKVCGCDGANVVVLYCNGVWWLCCMYCGGVGIVMMCVGVITCMVMMMLCVVMVCGNCV